MTTYYFFTTEQETTLIAALSLAAQQYAHPEIVIETLAVINRRAADAVRDLIAERDAVAS
jgi:hypothetical protein